MSAAHEAAVEIDRLISAILAPITTQLIERGEEIASRLAPVKNSLATLWAERGPTQYDAAEAYEQGGSRSSRRRRQ